MSKYKRVQVVFNIENAIHKELFEWLKNQSSNDSDFIRMVLLLYKESKMSEKQLISTNNIEAKITNDDADAMSGLL